MDWGLAAALLFWCGAWPRLAYPWRMLSLRDTFTRDTLLRSMLVEGWPLDLTLEGVQAEGGWRSS